MPLHTKSKWPILKTYDQDHLGRIAMPLGGIGTGTVSLGGRGDLRDWEVCNRPAKGFNLSSARAVGAFFALWAKAGRKPAVTRALEGVIDGTQYEGASGCPLPNHSLPRFRQCSFAAAYPLGQVMLRDADVPLLVRLEAFNPLVPVDVDASSIPAAVLRYVLINRGNKGVSASVCGTVTNFIGADGSRANNDWSGEPDYAAMAKDNRNEFRRGGGVSGLYMFSKALSPAAEAWGTMALSALAEDGVSYRTAWADVSWGDSLLDFWDDFSADGMIEDRPQGKAQAPRCSLAVRVAVPPRSERSVTFLLNWHFPNRMTWTPLPAGEAQGQGQGAAPCAGDCACKATVTDPNRVGNYYTTQYADAWDAALRTAGALGELERRTVEFVRAFCDSPLPKAVKEAALFNLSTLRSQTAFRIESGHMLGWEGCHDRGGCCHGSCTHVWNYEQATAFLFGSLSRTMRELEFLNCTDENGLMGFRVVLPLDRPQWKAAAADGQMGCLMKLYRDWQLCGDEEFLRRLWPQARKALEFCWVPGGWDADRDGVMEGCQHNTMDVEYYGPNGQMGTWYLGALRACEEIARHLGEADFADTCRGLFRRGSKWMDSHLFNGEYYEQEVRPPADEKAIAPGLRVGMGAADTREPDFQIGAGCLVDQLVGQYFAHVCGLGYLLKGANVRRTLKSILKYNFLKNFHGHFNHLRSYVLNEEAGLLMCSYPRGRRPRRPFPYYNEVMTGFEYTAAVAMLYEDMRAEGLRCIRAVRDRYDGRKRSPFDEAECGHHYARAMASWAAVPALTGFHYSGVDGKLELADLAGKGPCFWSTGDGWGVFRQRRVKKKTVVEVKVIHGRLALAGVEIKGVGNCVNPAPVTILPGETLTLTVR